MADPNKDIIVEYDVPVYSGRELLRNAAEKMDSAAEKIGSVVESASNLLDHWKIILIGALALVVLIKD